MKYALVGAKNAEVPTYLVSMTTFSLSDDDLAADMQAEGIGAPPGTILVTPGEKYKKQLGLNGVWTENGKDPTPEAVFTATGSTTGTLTNVVSGMSYQVGSAAAVEITGTSVNLSGLSATTIKISMDDSAEQSITVTKETTPSLTPVQPDHIGGKGSIPTTAAHQYSTNGTTYNDCTGPLENLDPGTYYIRVKAHGTVLASDGQSISITEYTGTKEDTPEAIYTATDETSGILSGLVNGVHYVASGAATADFTTSGTTYELTNVSEGTLSLVRKGDGVHTTDSDAQEISIESEEG